MYSSHLADAMQFIGHSLTTGYNYKSAVLLTTFFVAGAN
jgi:hypothetical protein